MFHLRAFSFSLHCCSSFRILCFSPLRTLMDGQSSSLLNLCKINSKSNLWYVWCDSPRSLLSSYPPNYEYIQIPVGKNMFEKVNLLFFWQKNDFGDHTFVGSNSSSICLSLLVLSSSRRRSLAFIFWLSDFCAWRLCGEQHRWWVIALQEKA